ncbi:PREDICTED: protein PHLOEM PROTEIN 2-LIKE A5-like [Camelina sativa]|uniref:Protein PHLOEM PROTEIN 2-LIKE A5-like n=1 Tax=Camelina sativa TaxID=90675 RepID=A0ABM0UDP4_CAMSA|nr:PREDICTED: protein PHLOEM PROTEIN 2-LIKE A5-like [Camelina sativa]
MKMPAFRRRPRPQIFISFQGNDDDLRKGFVSHVVKALKDARVNVFLDSDDRWERRGPHHHDHLFFRRIEKSELALVIFSDKYAESKQCLNELNKIHERVTEEELMVIPIFYKVNIEEVINLEGRFGKCFEETMMTQGRQNHQLTHHIMGCLRSIARKPGFTSGYYSNDSDLVEAIIQGIKKKIPYISAKQTIGEEVLAELLSASVVAALCFYFIPIAVFSDLGFFISPRWYLAVLLLFVVRHSLRLIQS